MRRILPALLATCLVTAIVAVVLFTPDELVQRREIPRRDAGTAEQCRNLDGRSGYFAPGIQQLPLSHLWSIAVEEQFYLIYPLLLIAITRYRLPYRRLTLIVLAVGFPGVVRLGFALQAGGELLSRADARLGAAARRNARNWRDAANRAPHRRLKAWRLRACWESRSSCTFTRAETPVPGNRGDAAVPGHRRVARHRQQPPAGARQPHALLAAAGFRRTHFLFTLSVAPAAARLR